MGSYEAIYYAVPMVGIPLNIDQHFNSKLYVKRKIGIHVDLNGITAEKITNAVDEVVKNSMYRYE